MDLLPWWQRVRSAASNCAENINTFQSSWTPSFRAFFYGISYNFERQSWSLDAFNIHRTFFPFFAVLIIKCFKLSLLYFYFWKQPLNFLESLFFSRICFECSLYLLFLSCILSVPQSLSPLGTNQLGSSSLNMSMLLFIFNALLVKWRDFEEKTLSTVFFKVFFPKASDWKAFNAGVFSFDPLFSLVPNLMWCQLPWLSMTWFPFWSLNYFEF